MAENENMTFKVGDRIAIDRQEDVLVVGLRCPMCAASGNTGAVPTPATRVWVPALLERWIPKWEREKYTSLEDAILKAPALVALVGDHNGRKESRWVCGRHGRELRAAKIWTEQLFWVMRKQAAAAERRAAEALGSIASLLGGKRVEEIKVAVVKAETRRTQAARKSEAAGRSDGRRPATIKTAVRRRGQKDED